MAKQKAQAKQQYKLTPVFQVDGIKHALEGVDIPEYKAISLIKIEGTTNWSHALLTIKDGQVTEMVVGEPNMWQVALDMAKIDFVRHFMKPDIN